ncbi:thioredoxin domain-containing protein [Sphingobacterium bovistauri]|uniref:Redoxin domain-containing protein n=1 Tax=Sphingobacterium bovistauri TaxID=2781959 RepID=A0ABS7Z554_9SPHI|nr:thioredoxin domain-containing protein [Sphingobacterium bovistauri]MCA5005326.1 redoxin domain-containing protein [Sphingobacterium bovistauri]
MHSLSSKKWEYKLRGASCTSLYFDYMTNLKHIIATTLLLSSLVSFGQSKISTQEAFKKTSNKKVQLLDVRTTEEYGKKHLKNAVNINWISKDNFEKETSKLNKKKPVYVYCLSGGRSSKAAQYLTEKGFNVFEIDGGIMQWEADNLPLEDSKINLSGLKLDKYKSLINSHPIVLVDFYADWCGPCKEMAPMIERIAKSYKDKVKVVKINVDENSTLTKQLGITGIPKLYIYKKGKESWSMSSLTDYETIEKALK